MKVDKRQQNSEWTYYLSGQIDESTNIALIIGDVPSPVKLDCSGITKINSSGVKTWINYFTALQSSGKEVVFSKLSIPLVEQVNALSNFSAGYPILQIETPFLCSNKACRKESKPYVDTKTLTPGEDPSSITCPECGSAAHFDDLADEYFAFLKSA